MDCALELLNEGKRDLLVSAIPDAVANLSKGSPSTRKALFKRSLSVRGGGLKTLSKWNVGVLQ